MVLVRAANAIPRIAMAPILPRTAGDSAEKGDARGRCEEDVARSQSEDIAASDGGPESTLCSRASLARACASMGAVGSKPRRCAAATPAAAAFARACASDEQS